MRGLPCQQSCYIIKGFLNSFIGLSPSLGIQSTADAIHLNSCGKLLQLPILRSHTYVLVNSARVTPSPLDSQDRSTSTQVTDLATESYARISLATLTKERQG